MSIRLNNSHRDYIANKAMQLSPINQSIKDHKATQYELAEKIRVHELGGAEETKRLDNIAVLLEQIANDIPDKVRCSARGISINSSLRLYFKRHSIRHYLDLSSPRVSNYYVDYDENYIYYNEINEYLTKLKRLEEQLKKLYYDVYASIKGITTLKKLLEVWPEVVELLPDELKYPTKTYLPAIRTTHLNELIGLPTKK